MLEQSWRIGDASGAEVSALEVFRSDPKVPFVRAQTTELYGEHHEPPSHATVYFHGVDERVGAHDEICDGRALTIRDDAIEIQVECESLPGTLIAPAPLVPGVLFFQGWNSSRAHYLPRAREIAAPGCFCLTFEPRGVAADDPRSDTVTREDNLHDIIAAYYVLANRAGLDRNAIGLVGSSYGAYLAAILTSLRPVRWLTLRAQALYRDEDWDFPKAQLDRQVLATYRNCVVHSNSNRALRACAAFRGDVLIVQSEHDDIIPPSVVTSYRNAFDAARSVTHRVIEGADHGLSEER